MDAALGIEWLRPAHAAWLVLAPLALVVGLVALTRSRRELAAWVSERQRARFLPGAAPLRARLGVVLGALALFFLALAVLGPARGHTYRAVSRKGLDLVVCLDTSRSMLAQDLRPSRLERAKREIHGLLDHLRGDRVALVAFSGDARDVAPLTRDRETLRGLLAYVSPDDNRAGGTDLAAAIEHALALFDGRSGAHEAIVLLTDGEDLEGRAAAQAEEALKRKIRVFVVGVGTEAGGKIPVAEPDGRSAFLRDPEGNEVVSKLERESLVALARLTGGEFLSAEESPTPLEELYEKRIGRLEGREIEGGERRVPYDRFQWPLALALGCFLARLALRERPPRGEGRARLAAGLVPFILLGGDAPRAPEVDPRRLVELFERGEHAAAEEAARALVTAADALALPEASRARAHFALGVVAATRAIAPAEPGDDPAAGESARDAARETARTAFTAARALAGPGELRDDATFDLGALELFRAEELRAQLPELGGAPPQPMLPPPNAQPGAADAPPPPDPLPAARERYRAARTWLVERLRLDWRDADTRADLELIQRRLRELDEIEKKREEEKQQQEQQQDQNQDQEQDDSKDGDPKEKNDDSESKDPSKSDPESDPKEPPPDELPGEPKEEPKSEPKDGEAEESPPPEEPNPGEPKDEGEVPPPEAAPEPAGEAPPSERVLTREEVMQLLDKLAELEKQQKALQAALRARQQARTKRDW
jgi:Ca-activated chloride channel family protein